MPDSMSLDTSQWDPYDRNCPSRRLLDRIGDRWTVLTIGALADGPHRFGVLTSRIDGVSQKMLTQTPRGLSRHSRRGERKEPSSGASARAR